MTNEQLATFLIAAQTKCDAEHDAARTNHNYTKLSAEPGRRYVRIVAEQGGQRSVWCFIDTTNGDVLKGALTIFKLSVDNPLGGAKL